MSRFASLRCVLLTLTAALTISVGCSRDPAHPDDTYHTLSTAKSSDVDLATLGYDIVSGKFWTPSVDFSQGSKYYFDPTAAQSGSGTLNNPFCGLGAELAVGTNFEWIDHNGTVHNQGAPVSQGDVCVLLDGNHGSIIFNDFRNTQYMGLVAMPGATASFDSLKFVESQYFYIEGLSCSGLQRDDWPDPGYNTSNPYDSGPYYISLRTENGNRFCDHFIVKDCTLKSDNIATADTWTNNDWNNYAVGGLFSDRSDYIHLQDNYCEVVNYGFTVRMCDYLNILGNSVYHNCGDGFKLCSATYAHIAENALINFFVTNANHVDIIQIFGGVSNSHHILIERNRGYETSDLARINDSSFHGILFSQGGTDVDVSNNIIYVNGTYGISSTSATRMSIVNNTVFGSYADTSDSMVRICYQENCTYDSCIANNNITGDVLWYNQQGITVTNNRECAYDFTGEGFLDWSNSHAPLEQDVHLTTSSPALDGGSLTNAPDYDYDLVSRPWGAYPDIGAFEYFRSKPGSGVEPIQE